MTKKFEDKHIAEKLLTILESDDPSQIESFFENLTSGDEARALAQLSKEQLQLLMESLGTERNTAGFDQESAIGIINGVILGLLLGGLALLWKGNSYLGLVVGALWRPTRWLRSLSGGSFH